MYIDLSKNEAKDSKGNVFLVETITDGKIIKNNEGHFALADKENKGELSISLTKLNLNHVRRNQRRIKKDTCG